MARENKGVFSKRLIQLRQEFGVSQSAFGAAMDIPRSTISGYETEGKEPDYDTLNKMADYFAVSCDYLLGRTDARKPYDVVFYRDANNFKKHYEALPDNLRSLVAETFDEFYMLMFNDVKTKNAERLTIYRDLMTALRSGRGELRNTVQAISAGILPPSALAQILSKESELKTSVAAYLDALLENEMKSSEFKK